MLLSAVVELSVRPGHQAVTASVCSDSELFSVATGESDQKYINVKLCDNLKTIKV